MSGEPAFLARVAGDLRALLRVYRGGTLPAGWTASPRAPVLVVLGTEVLPGGRPSGTLRARALHAAALYHSAGGAQAVVVTGGVGAHPPSEAEVAAGVLEAAGVPGAAVLEERRARSTRESAWLVPALLEERGLPRSVVVVTDPLHCVRAVRAFREEGLLAVASPAYGSPMWRGARERRGQLVREAGAVVWYAVASAARRARRGAAMRRAGLPTRGRRAGR